MHTTKNRKFLLYHLQTQFSVLHVHNKNYMPTGLIRFAANDFANVTSIMTAKLVACCGFLWHFIIINLYLSANLFFMAKCSTNAHITVVYCLKFFTKTEWDLVNKWFRRKLLGMFSCRESQFFVKGNIKIREGTKPNNFLGTGSQSVSFYRWSFVYVCSNNTRRVTPGIQSRQMTSEIVLRFVLTKG